MRQLLVASVMVMLMTVTSAFAADQKDTSASAPASGVAALAPRFEIDAYPAAAHRSYEPRRPMALPALYGASALLQGYDAYSTLTVLKHGGTEANPVVKGLTRNPAAFIGLKAGVTMMSIMAAERLWKNRNKVGAVATMLITNGVMTAVAANNARVLSRVQ